jgi:hypothetical protein
MSSWCSACLSKRTTLLVLIYLKEESRTLLGVSNDIHLGLSAEKSITPRRQNAEQNHNI